MILVLNDPHCRTAGQTLTHCLRLSFGKAVVKSVHSQEMIQSLQSAKPAVIVLPEIKGETNYYPQYLGENGKRLIHKQVQGGTMYVGYCAGAYNACASNTYTPPHGMHKHRSAEQLLDLAPVDASGPLKAYARAMDETTHIDRGHSCVEVPIIIKNGDRALLSKAWYENGCYFHHDMKDIANDPLNVILARYNLGNKFPVASFTRRIGKGAVLLSGVLPHLSTEQHNPDHPLWNMHKDIIREHLLAFSRPALV